MKRLTCLLLACLTALALTACGAEKPQEISLFAMDTYMTLAAYGDSADDALTAASREINRLEAKLKDAKYRALSTGSKYTEKTRLSFVLQALRNSKDSVLKIPDQPPYKIQVPEEGGQGE